MWASPFLLHLDKFQAQVLTALEHVLFGGGTFVAVDPCNATIGESGGFGAVDFGIAAVEVDIHQVGGAEAPHSDVSAGFRNVNFCDIGAVKGFRSDELDRFQMDILGVGILKGRSAYDLFP